MVVGMKRFFKSSSSPLHITLGASGTGKTTFVNTLCENQVFQKQDHSNPETSLTDKTVSITPHVVEMDEDVGRLTLTVLDTPGFGDNINNEKCFEDILAYIEAQFDNVLAEESRIKRNTKSVDSRVHCILYFVSPHCHGLKEMDIQFIRKLGTRANIIPVIAKADSLTNRELSQLKKKIQEELLSSQLPFFNFPVYEEEDNEEVIQENTELRASIPFSIMGSEEMVLVDGVRRRGRQYPWGTVFVDNPKHSDFAILRRVIFYSHLEDLKEITHDVLYESYRTLKLSTEVGA